MTTAQAGTVQPATTEYVDVLVYSDDSTTRASVVEGVGRRAAKGLPLLRWTEAATAAAAFRYVKEGDFAALVLDGEVPKVGGMALAHQLKTEIYRCPPVLVLTARPQDRWLATFADADAMVSYPLDPLELQQAVATLVRQRLVR